MQPTTVVVQSQQPRGGCCSCAIMCLGITEIVFGVMILVAGIAAIVLTPKTDLLRNGNSGAILRSQLYPYMNTGPGIWCGIFVIITGILGVLIRADTSSKIMYIVNMVSAIVAALLSIACMILAGVAIVAVLLAVGVVAAAMHAITIILAFVTMIITMIHACACCEGACRDPAQQQVVIAQVPVQSAYPGNQGMPMQENPQMHGENPPLYPGIEKA